MFEYAKKWTDLMKMMMIHQESEVKNELRVVMQVVGIPTNTNKGKQYHLASLHNLKS